MKKIIALILALIMVLSFAACGETPAEEPETEEPTTEEPGTEEPEEPAVEYAVAMVTDYGDITDQSFNQTTYEACKAFAEANSLQFEYFKPAADSDADRVAQIENAIDGGYNVIVLPGFAFANAIKETAEVYPEVIFIALDVAAGDFGDWTIPANVFSAVYQEELSGYMAGYATVKLGYTKLGYCGGMAVPAVIRFGYGFVQGADDAAAELGVEASIKYAYANQFYGDADITAAMDTWYGDGVEVVFACGGGVFTSVAEAAAKVGGKVVGVDVDQAPIIDGWGEGMTITSAMKGLAPTVNTMLQVVLDGEFANYGGQVQTFGIVSEDPSANYVQLPASTQWADGFTEDDYKQLVADLYNGVITVDSNTEITVAENASVLTVEDLGNIK